MVMVIVDKEESEANEIALLTRKEREIGFSERLKSLRIIKII
jgi:hypothetical protein